MNGKNKKMGGSKVLFKILKVILIVIVVLVAMVVILYLWADNKPAIHKGYQEKIETGGELEQKYLQNGPYETKKKTVKEEKPIKKYTIYYPSELEEQNKKYPMVLIVNGTGGKATKYEPEFAQLSSWGFIVVGTQDKGTGKGETTIKTLNYMLSENEDKDSIFYGKIDIDNIGVTGHSQGGAAAIRAAMLFEESRYFKTVVPLSPVCEKTTAQMTDYTYDISQMQIPIFLLAGTSGEFEIELVIPLEEMSRMYDKISSPKVMARRTGMTHDDMLYKAEGYVTAWFLWQLKEDQEAAKAFLGDQPELLGNPLYQDQRIDLQE